MSKRTPEQQRVRDARILVTVSSLATVAMGIGAIADPVNLIPTVLMATSTGLSMRELARSKEAERRSKRTNLD